MTRLTINISEALSAKLNALARRRRQKRADVVRQAIEHAVNEADEAQPFSVLELVEDLIDTAGQGPKDLSTNPKYMRGYGE